jgi:uncharacterized membrane protein YkvA (DUF1232 family)
MSIDISFTLSDRDLAHFAQGIDVAGRAAGQLDAGAIIGSAHKLLDSATQTELPDFVRSRLQRLQLLIAMVEDAGFALPDEERRRVLAALTYFADPDDAIPDSVPVLGYLDDAIMIELCVRELHHELEAYEDFRDWREAEAGRRGEDPSKLTLNRVDWAEARREETIQRMRRRRESSYTSGQWAPVLFKVR